MRSQTLIVEIRAAEGGADSKSLVEAQMALYVKYTDHKRL